METDLLIVSKDGKKLYIRPDATGIHPFIFLTDELPVVRDGEEGKELWIDINEAINFYKNEPIENHSDQRILPALEEINRKFKSGKWKINKS